MYITESNLQIEIKNMTNILVMIKVRLQEEIDNKLWQTARETMEDERWWEWNMPLLNEMMEFIKTNHPEQQFADMESPERILMEHVGEFFRLLIELEGKGKYEK